MIKRGGSAVMAKEELPECPVATAVSLIGGKWKLLIIRNLRERPWRYIYAGLQGGSIMRGWMERENEMVCCCNDGTRPVIFKLERIDIPEEGE